MVEIYPVIEGSEEFFFKGNEIGVLVSHGFVGTPQSVRYIGEEFAKQGYTVLAPRLKGHGTHKTDLESCTNKDWYHSLEKAYHQLKQSCTRIFVVGQSMGGALALWLAHYHQEIHGLITINAALDVPAYDHLRGKNEPRFLPESKPDIKARDVYEITYEEVPLKSIQQLQVVMDKTIPMLPTISCPILGIHSAVDHVVPPESTEYILNNVGSSIKERLVLPHSYHVASMDLDKDLIVEMGVQFIQKLTVKELVK